MPSYIDPAVDSRRRYSTLLSSEGPPDNASVAFAKLWEDTNKLVEKLADHEAMQPNIDRLYGEPARRRSKVYFMWDFVTRTRALMLNVNPAKPSRSRGDGYMDLVGRSMMTSNLIDDEDKTVDQMCNEPGDDALQFGPEIVALAKQIGRDANDID